MDTSLKGQDFFGEIPYSEKTLKKNPILNATRAIPQTTLNTVFSFLDPKSFFNLTQVNRFFKTEILQNPESLQREKLYFIEIEFRDEDWDKQKRKEVASKLLHGYDKKIFDTSLKFKWINTGNDYELLSLYYFSNENIMQARKFLMEQLIYEDMCFTNSKKTILNVYVKGDEKRIPVFEEFSCHILNISEDDYNRYYGGL
jgi:hypothetical protein